MGDERVYHCPVCSKPFDLDDKLFDFAIAAHEKDHQTAEPGRLLVKRGSDWACTRCGEVFGPSEEMATLAMVTHMRTHGVTAPSAAPVATRDGGSGGRRGFGEFVADLAEDVGNLVGEAAGKLFDRY